MYYEFCGLQTDEHVRLFCRQVWEFLYLPFVVLFRAVDASVFARRYDLGFDADVAVVRVLL